MTTISTTHRSLVSLSLPETVPSLLTYAEQIVLVMTGNASFPTPMPTLAAVSQAVTDLQSAEAAALSRAKGAVPARNDKRSTLVRLLQLLKTYVQNIADGNAETAPTVITSAGLAGPLLDETTRAPGVVRGPGPALPLGHGCKVGQRSRCSAPRRAPTDPVAGVKSARTSARSRLTRP